MNLEQDVGRIIWRDWEGMDGFIGRIFTEGMKGVSRLIRGGVAVDLLRLSQFVEIFGCRVNRLFQKKSSFFEAAFGKLRTGWSAGALIEHLFYFSVASICLASIAMARLFYMPHCVELEIITLFDAMLAQGRGGLLRGRRGLAGRRLGGICCERVAWDLLSARCRENGAEEPHKARRAGIRGTADGDHAWRWHDFR